ncbi:FGGY-family carbohydrate kinase [Labrys monachus]|uniref:L-xylulokinase n=1 Tax=Labrys monachus TaxID=217067 RepID=A0ABU0FFE5_9HYPH|nr:FGGY-family carbohydrate kinase [Labrys monachus]MDQ0392775.1 L-xylulokinase [Labrys monachus]
MLLGLDCGSTAIKAALFDETGRTVGIAGHRTAPVHPAPGFVEQDPDLLWKTAASAIRDVLARTGIDAAAIAGIGVTGHGDGVYLADRHGRALGNGIQSVDSRAHAVTAAWREAGILDEAERLTAQRPYPYAATTLLAWIKQYQPERYHHISHVMFCKDWLRFRLAGVFATDPTDASTAFTEPHRQGYDTAILSLFGLDALQAALPPVLPSAGCIGRVTEEAAQATGLLAGTPVSGGMHDVTASAVGLGNLEPGSLSITAGTFSINETLSDRLVVDPRWAARAGLRPGQWMNMSISPASSNNVDWFLAQAYRAEIALAAQGGPPLWSQIEADLAEPPRPDAPIFHPFLYGSPYSEPASASFLGLRSWHTRADMLKAVIEGAVFNHRHHADALASAFPLERAGITGGGSSAPRTAQFFADALGMPVEIPEATEIGALGVALVAGVGIGLYESLEDATGRACRVTGRYAPDPARHAELNRRFRRYQALADAVRPFWTAPAAAD